MAINANKKPCSSYYCDSNVGCPKGCGGCREYQCSGDKPSYSYGQSRGYRRFTGGGQTPLNVQPQWANNGTRDQVFVGMDGTTMTSKSMSDMGNHTMPVSSTELYKPVMPGASHSEGYGSIFSEKNYWIGVAAGVIGLLAYQKYFKK